MKFFSEFGSCFGGAAVAMSADSIAQPPLAAAVERLKRSTSSRTRRLTNWKPALSAISEDAAASEAGRRALEAKVRSQKKTKERSRAYADDYYYSKKKDLVIAANPGFLPTPYLF